MVYIKYEHDSNGYSEQVKKEVSINYLVKIIGYLIIISFAFPVFRFGSIGFKFDFPLIIFAVVLLSLEKQVSNFKVITYSKFVAFFLLLAMFLSDNIGNLLLDQLGRPFVIPTEFVQVFTRIAVLYIFLYIGYHNIISFKKFNTLVSLVFISSLIWGFLQAFNIEPIKSLSIRFYALTDMQKHVLDKAQPRILGTAGNAITWGGLSVLLFFYFYYIGRKGVIRIAGCTLAIINLALSASRAALIAFLIAYVIFEFYSVFIYKNKNFILSLFKKFSKLIFLMGGLLAFLIVLFYDRLLLILLRIDNTQDDLTEKGRGEQLDYFSSLFSQNLEYYFTGIGKQTLDSLGFMEMEPFYLLFSYGVVGFFLHYALIFILLRTVYKLRKYNKEYSSFIFVSTFFFLVFSFGFFFFREAYSGTPFWWLSGYLIGCLMKEKHTQLNQLQRI